MKLNLNLHTMIMLAGPTGSGKSTLAAQLKKQLQSLLEVDGYPPNVQIVSSDTTRRRLLDHDYPRHDAIMLQVSKQAFELMEQETDRLMQWPIAAPFIIIDATNLATQNRKRFLEIANKNHYYSDILVMNFSSREEYVKYLPEGFSKLKVYRGIDSLRDNIKYITHRDFNKVYKIPNKEFSDITVEVTKLGLWKRTFLNNDGSTHVIADIHGCLFEFCQSLTELGYTIEEGKLIVPEEKRYDTIVLLGDFIDKGPQNAETIDFIHANLDRFTIVEGNHERFIYKWFNGDRTESVTDEVLEKYFTCTTELEGDTDRLTKFNEILKKALPFVRGRKFFANHAPCEQKYLGKVDPVSLRNQRNIRVSRADVIQGETPDNVIESQKQLWENSLKFWEDQAVTNYPYHLVGHLPLLRASRVKNQFMIDGGCANGGTLITATIGWDKPKISYVPKQTETKYVDRLFPIFDQDPRHRVDVTDLDRDGLLRLKFAAKNNINFISGTMSPADKSDNELETIDKGYEYYRKNGIEKVILQLKYMGSRCNLYLNRNVDKCYAASRGGNKIRTLEQSPERGIDLGNLFCDQLSRLKNYFDIFKIEWMIIDGELLPWHALGKGLIESVFKPIQHAVESEMLFLKNSGFLNMLQRSEDEMNASGFLQDQETMKKDLLAKKYGHSKYSTWKEIQGFPSLDLDAHTDALTTYKKQIALYGQPGPLEFKGFAVLKEIYQDGSERTFFDKTNQEVYELTGNKDPCCIVDLNNEASLEAGRVFYQEAAAKGLEGIVMKPEMVYVPKVAPYLKVRNPDYLTLIYGFDYKMPFKYNKLLKQKSTKRKIKTSIAEFEIGKGLLEIPRSEISKDNPKYGRLIAQMITQEKLEKDIDPRL